MNIQSSNLQPLASSLKSAKKRWRRISNYPSLRRTWSSLSSPCLTPSLGIADDHASQPSDLTENAIGPHPTKTTKSYCSCAEVAFLHRCTSPLSFPFSLFPPHKLLIAKPRRALPYHWKPNLRTRFYYILRLRPLEAAAFHSLQRKGFDEHIHYLDKHSRQDTILGLIFRNLETKYFSSLTMQIAYLIWSQSLTWELQIKHIYWLQRYHTHII